MNISTHDVMSDIAQAAIAADVLTPIYYEDTVAGFISTSYGAEPVDGASDIATAIECINNDRDYAFVATYNKDGEPWILYRSRTV